MITTFISVSAESLSTLRKQPCNATVQMSYSASEPIPRMMSMVSLQKQDSDASSSIRGEYVYFFRHTSSVTN